MYVIRWLSPLLFSIVVAESGWANPVWKSSSEGLVRATKKGEYVCKELKYPLKKYVCNYIPIHESADKIQTRIFCQFSGCRQFPNPDLAYVRVLHNGQIEIANDDMNFMNEILSAVTNDFDTLESHIPRRRVHLDLRVYELVKNANDNLEFMIREAAVVGKRGTPMTPGNRLNILETTKGLGLQLSLGNLVSSLLTAALTTLEATSDVLKLTHTVQKELTNGSSLTARKRPIEQNNYITPSTISTFTEVGGIQFEGEVRFLENLDNKIKISGFGVRISQQPHTPKTDGSTPGLIHYSFGPGDLYFDIGCAQVLNVTNTGETIKKIEKRFFGLDRREYEEKIKKEFIAVVQVLDSTPRNSDELPACENAPPDKIPAPGT